MSPRPRRMRRLRLDPTVTYFKPAGVPMRSLDVVELSREEFEAVVLTQYNGLSQTEAAQEMRTSQSTLQRILASGLAKLATALVEGSAIRIEA